MIFNRPVFTADSNDASLVVATLDGNRDAFAEIVGRYQRLVCSLAYSATGSLTQSEDLAQETFVTAWKQLRHLQDPQKLRSWLCGIARNIINNALRRQGREPIYHAETLETAVELFAPEPHTSDRVIRKEEEAILWRSLERVPVTYREPLVLFYREGQSIERVARDLELSEDAVKQRLSRGRKLLSEEVALFVEGALHQSAPGKAFTLGVLATLPLLTTSAKAATIGATAAKGSSAAKAAGAIGLIGALFAPVVVIFGTWLGYRMSCDDAQSDTERRYVKSFYRRLTAMIVSFFVVLGTLMICSDLIIRQSPALFAGAVIAAALTYAFSVVALSLWARRMRAGVATQVDSRRIAAPIHPAYEYRSKSEWLGLPFIHVRIGGGIAAQRRPVKGWIAIGDCAIGGLFAFGGFALAPP